MRPCYQLRATGDSQNGWAFKMSSKKVYTAREAAKAHIPAFTAACIDDKYFDCAVPDTLEVKIVELELHE